MKICRKSIVAAAILAFAGTAAGAADLEPVDAPDDSGWYLRGDAGYGFVDNGDDGFIAGIGLGYRFSDMLRADVRGDINDIDSVLANAYLDFDLGSVFTPYIGAGAGWGWANSDDGFTVALMAGVGFDLSDNLALDIGYRFREAMVSGSDPMSHEILAGLRFEF
ncbi:MAG: outer membrane protein [Methylococcales bacterium]